MVRAMCGKDAHQQAADILKDWVFRLKLGNGITAEGWIELCAQFDNTPPDVYDILYQMVLELEVAVDHGDN